MSVITRKSRIDASFDLTPLIDVVFQLLIFVMISSHFSKPESVVDLPIASGRIVEATANTDTVSITLTEAGGIEVNGVAIAREGFESEIARQVAAGSVRAEFRGDRDAPYGLFVELMESAKNAGIESLGIARQVGSRQQRGKESP